MDPRPQPLGDWIPHRAAALIFPLNGCEKASKVQLGVWVRIFLAAVTT